jgi:predicted metal-dependent enzyme (double-stranded beta helix superfamily)
MVQREDRWDLPHEYVFDVPIVRQLIGLVRETLTATPPAEALAVLRPSFAALLADPTWLPERYRQPAPEGGSAGSTWLLYRAVTGDLSLAVLVLPPGAAMLLQDPRAWGLVGLYHGEQEAEVYRRRPGPAPVSGAPLERTARLRLCSGECFALLPPNRAVYRVVTTSTQPALSIHLAGWSKAWRLESFSDGAGI